MKLILTADWHLGCKQYGDPRREQDFYDAATHIVEKACKRQEDLIIAGDIVDSIYPSEAAIEVLKNLHGMLMQSKVTAYFIAGNHDNTDRHWIHTVIRKEDEYGFKEIEDLTDIGNNVKVFPIVSYFKKDILAELENPKAKEANIIVMHTRCKEFAGFAHKDYWSLQADFNEEDYPNLKCVLIGDTHVNMTIVKPETGKVYVSPGSIEMRKSNEPIIKYVVEYDTDTNQTNCIEIVPSYHIIRSEMPITTEDQLSQFIQDIRGKSIGVPPNRAFIIVTYSPQMETQVLSQIKNEIVNNRENVILQGYAIPIIATPDNKELVYVQPSGDLNVIDSIVDFVTKKGCSMDKPLGLSQDGFNLFKNLIDKAHNTEQELNGYVNNNNE